MRLESCCLALTLSLGNSQTLMKTPLFTLDEANEMVPYLTERMARLSGLKAEIDATLKNCEERDIDVPKLLQTENLEEPLSTIRRILQTLGDEINDILYEIQEKGMVVKDIDKGLVDFFCEMDGATVFLCWKLGENDIRFFHGVNEGFENRQSLLERRFLEQVTKLH